MFPDPGMTVAAIDRLVHHSTIFELHNVESYRGKTAERNQKTQREAEKASRRRQSSSTPVVSAFYENVNRHRVEGRELREGEDIENGILQFRPRPTQDMLVACLWSKWSGPGEPDLLSFAAITDDPPPEVSAAGHDRCIIPIKPEHIDAWLTPDRKNLAAQYAILDDRERPYYEHRFAA